jgi:lipopolysaccharide/colanic/teichoic acid biosynthesis glycosyltransferase
MQTEFLPANSPDNKPSFPPLHNALDKINKSEKSTGFFYIGKNNKKIDFLIKAFDSGYAADNALSAISILKRIREKDNTPDIIIIDAILEEPALKEFDRFVATNPWYLLVPCVMDASEKSEEEIAKCRKAISLDEIIDLGNMDSEKLLLKVDFLKKIKMQPKHHQAGKKIQTSSINTVWEPKDIFKRAFDVAIASVTIMILSPLLLVIALAIKIESGSPVLYISKRAGRGYRIFDFYKFRTMVIDADKKIDQISHLNQYNNTSGKKPVFFKAPNDPRVTKVGTFLRNTSLDELPQFFNVIKGDMSLVGNRPLPLYEAASLTTDELAARFMAPVGITGLWQIKKRGHKVMSVEERINLDIAYVDKNNFMYDLWIMANTPSALIQKTDV